jgi:hypothetical protein
VRIDPKKEGQRSVTSTKQSDFKPTVDGKEMYERLQDQGKEGSSIKGFHEVKKFNFGSDSDRYREK